MGIDAAIPKGTRDFLPEQVRRREYVVSIIREVYERYGFEPLETPAIENIETLQGKYGEEGDQLIFKILKRGAKAATGECDLGLRYDLTVPLARVAAMHENDLPRVFKRYQIQPVWRADRPGRGRFREFYQCDIDAVGAKGILAEIDLLAAVSEAFEALGFEGVTLRLNDRRILSGLIAVSDIADELGTSAITAIDKLDKIGFDGVRAELDKRGIRKEAAEKLIGLLDQLANSDDIVTELRDVFAGRESVLAAVDDLDEIVSSLELVGGSGAKPVIDPYLARGLNYYTGAIYEVAVDDLAGSLAGGGRYDGLIGMFLGRDIPAVGVTLGLERILIVMEERGMFPERTSQVDAMVTTFGEETRREALQTASRLRAMGFSIDLYPQPDKLGKQFRYANNRDIPFVILVGPDEVAEDKVSIKDMESGEQVVVNLEEAARLMRSGGVD